MQYDSMYKTFAGNTEPRKTNLLKYKRNGVFESGIHCKNGQ